MAGLNIVGLAAALATFLGVWLGHVMVRKVEAQVSRIGPAMGVCISLGLACEAGALLSRSNALSGALGILGITLLWDALEFVRQEKRVRIGHAPANPANPRHARILAQHTQATTIDWLEREPRGKAYAAEELQA